VSGTGSHIYLVGSGYLYLGDPPILRGIVDVPVVETTTTTATVLSSATTINKIAKTNTLPKTGDSTDQMLLVVGAMFVMVGAGLRLR